MAGTEAVFPVELAQTELGAVTTGVAGFALTALLFELLADPHVFEAWTVSVTAPVPLGAKVTVVPLPVVDVMVPPLIDH